MMLHVRCTLRTVPACNVALCDMLLAKLRRTALESGSVTSVVGQFWTCGPNSCHPVQLCWAGSRSMHCDCTSAA